MREVTRVRDRLAKAARTAVLSNASRLGDPAVRAALAAMDVPILKLDAGTEATFQRLARPLPPGVALDEIVAGMASLEGITIQSLFCGGAGGNSSPEDVAAWAERVRAIRPACVQVYSVDRGYPSRDIEQLGPARLGEIAAALGKDGPPVTVF